MLGRFEWYVLLYFCVITDGELVDQDLDWSEDMLAIYCCFVWSVALSRLGTFLAV